VCGNPADNDDIRWQHPGENEVWRGHAGEGVYGWRKCHLVDFFEHDTAIVDSAGAVMPYCVVKR
jgi:hypothetical protein